MMLRTYDKGPKVPAQIPVLLIYRENINFYRKLFKYFIPVLLSLIGVPG
jgi:hypothetical protein